MDNNNPKTAEKQMSKIDTSLINCNQDILNLEEAIRELSVRIKPILLPVVENYDKMELKPETPEKGDISSNIRANIQAQSRQIRDLRLQIVNILDTMEI